MTPHDAVRPTGAPSASSGSSVRRRAILAVLALAAAAMVSGVPVWLRTSGSTALGGEVAVGVTGTQAAPGVPAAALVLLAAGVAAGLAGRVGRWVVVVVVLLAGLLQAASALSVAADPGPVARTAVADATGVEALTVPVTLTAWPWAAAAVGVLVVLTGAWLGATSGRWARPSDRHDVPRPGATGPGAGASDPTPGDPPAPGAPGSPGARAHPGATVAPAAAVPDDDQAAWDALTRGHDPS